MSVIVPHIFLILWGGEEHPRESFETPSIHCRSPKKKLATVGINGSYFLELSSERTESHFHTLVFCPWRIPTMQKGRIPSGFDTVREEGGEERRVYSARAQDGPQEMDRNWAAARHSWARQHDWLLLKLFPFPVGHPEHEHSSITTEDH